MGSGGRAGTRSVERHSGWNMNTVLGYLSFRNETQVSYKLPATPFKESPFFLTWEVALEILI